MRFDSQNRETAESSQASVEARQSSAELQERMRKVLNSDRAALSPTELRELQARIAKALGDLMVLEEDGIEYNIEREQGRRILRLSLPVREFVRDKKER